MLVRKQLSKKFRSKSSKRGVASLIVTVAFALLFVVLVVALTALSLREQRQASDSDQSNRAFTAAEAGIKDALSRLNKDSGLEINNCESYMLDSTNQYGWTCLTITRKSGDIEGKADKDESKTAAVYMAGQPAPDGGGGNTSWADHLNFYWSKRNTTDKKPSSAPPSPTYPSLSDPSSWDKPAGIELTFVYWKPNDTANPKDISVGLNSFDSNKSLMTKTYFIMPSANGGTNGDASPVHTANNISSSCSETSLSGRPGKKDYYCKLVQNSTDGIDLDTVFGGDSKDYRFIFKVKPRYSSTNYYAAFTANGDQVMVPATSAIIDVTARSGNVYRRIRAERSLETRARGTVFDSAVFSGTDICKNLTVDSGNNTKTFNSCD